MIRTEIRTRIIAREQSILARLVGKYRGDQLTGDDARSGIATLTELRSLLSDLDRDVRKSEEAEKVVLGPAMVTRQEDL
jgi:hypothetical protein